MSSNTSVTPFHGGTFGMVWLQEVDRPLIHTRALKKIYPKPTILIQKYTEYENEWEEISTLTFSHENMVMVWGTSLINESMCITMELMDKNLTNLLEKNPGIALDRRLSILCDVINGIGHLHCNGWFHGNLHSNNVFLTATLLAKVGDVMPKGLIQEYANKEKLRNFAPRKTAGRPIQSLDIFAFGLIICHVFTTKWPMPKGGNSIDINEADRYQYYWQQINNRVLQELVVNCLRDSPPESDAVYTTVMRIKKGAFC